MIGGVFPRMGKLSPQRITPGLITPIGAVHAHREWVAVLGENKWFEIRLNSENVTSSSFLFIDLARLHSPAHRATPRAASPIRHRPARE